MRPLRSHSDSCYHSEIKCHRCQVMHVSASGKKRFATIVVTSNADADWEQPPIGIIFRGSNKILEKEMHGYHPDVRVQFNEKVFLREYLERQCFKWLEEDGSCHEHQCFPVYGPPGRTLVFLNSS